ncbi:MAG: phosphoribosyltransferase [Planctomycetota bacterium]
MNDAPLSSAAAPPFRRLFSNQDICRRADELVRDLRRALGDTPPCLVQVVEGARPFARLIQRGFPGQVVHEVRAKSYQGTESVGDVRVDLLGGLDAAAVAGRDVVVLEDIVDTGRTIEALRRVLRELGARRVRVVTLLSKPSRRVVDVEVEHVGFEIPDEFVIGFGMDLDERYRELSDVVVFDPEVERAFGAVDS